MSSLPDFGAVRVLCVGDVMLDRFVEGTVERISPESPVPVVRLGEAHGLPGGAANVARNIAALGGRCTLVGVVGADSAAAELTRLLAASPSIAPALVADPGRPTTEKIRYVARGQQLLRADREAPGALPARAENALLAAALEAVAEADVVVLSDYAKGVLSDRVVAAVIERAAAAGLPVVVDPKSAALGRYRGATLVAPNAREAEAATGIDAADDAGAEAAAAAIVARAGIAAALVTRAERGMTLVEGSAPALHLPAGAREVFDVAGAGDTVVAVLALGLGAGLAAPDAARLANAAAGVVVGKRGTATVSRGELLDELARLSHTGVVPAAAKVIDGETARAWRTAWRRDGLRVGFTNGCFDLLHVGHARLLEFARAHCDRLVVGLNSDASVRRLKGDGRPVNGFADRAELLAALGSVDAVVGFEEDTPASLIAALAPDLLVKGADYALDEIVGADLVRAGGGQVLRFELVPGRSTSAMLARGAA